MRVERAGTFPSSSSMKWNVGILLGTGVQAPYASRNLRLLTGALLELEGNASGADILSAQRPEEKLPWLAERNSLDGILWIFPNAAGLKAIAEANASGLPSVALFAQSFHRTKDYLQANYIAWDYEGGGRKRARFFLRRGLKRIAYAGSINRTFECFLEELRAAGIDYDVKSLLFENASDLRLRLPELLRRGEVDGIVADGPLSRMEALLATLSACENGRSIALRLDYPDGLDDLLVKYGAFNVLAIAKPDSVSYGRSAAALLLRTLKSGAAQEPLFVVSRAFDPLENVLEE
jgi:DNA-binding LacI/PurR family transcriptional regulator